jgi:thiosulfate/3-mercaptopyruvate sulfurtransferase
MASSPPVSAVVTTSWVADHLPSLTLIDCSWYMPGSGRDARAEFDAERLPGACFFDLDAVCDVRSALPHMLPPARVFAAACDALGVTADSHVVLYDGSGCFSSPRGWFTFSAAGHTRVSVMEGGLPLWRKQDRPCERTPPRVPVGTGAAAAAAAAAASGHDPAYPAAYAAKAGLVASLDEVLTLLAGNALLVDARSAGRFAGTEPEPRQGVRSGHAPGAVNLPFSNLLGPDGTLLPPEELRAAFRAAGVPIEDASRRIVASCGAVALTRVQLPRAALRRRRLTRPPRRRAGTGVTACVVALAAATLGRDITVYDGSWTEYGSQPEERCPVITGS